jgi:predicted metalloprotease with PDZ domain
MRRNGFPCWLLVCLLLLNLSGARPLASARLTAPHVLPPTDRIAYDLTPLLSMSPRRLQVTMRFLVPSGTGPLDVQMPVWSPGDYHIQNHARYVQNLRAWAGSPDAAHSLTVTHPDANTWEMQPAGAAWVTLTYLLSDPPPGLFCENVRLQAARAFVNGPAAYLYLVGHKEAPVVLTVHLPQGWHVETPLQPMSAEAETASFVAPDYDTLADAPVLMADPDAMLLRTFACNGVTHHIVFYGGPLDTDEAAALPPLLQRIVQAETQIMGSTPYPRYTFFYNTDGRGAGLEHSNACVIELWPHVAPHDIALLTAHEFFHLWNVKRIRPRVLGPFDYIHPPHTRNLWFAEGITEYYAHIACLRAGLISADEFLQHYRDKIEEMQRNPARLRVTADEASLRVWESGNSQGYGGLSYYDKGELIGLCLDLKIRQVTANQRSLDDVMRTLMARYSPPRPGYGEEDLRAAISAVAEQDLSAFYDRLARSTQELPYAACLADAGLDSYLAPRLDATPAQRELRTHWLAPDPPGSLPGSPER